MRRTLAWLPRCCYMPEHQCGRLSLQKRAIIILNSVPLTVPLPVLLRVPLPVPLLVRLRSSKGRNPLQTASAPRRQEAWWNWTAYGTSWCDACAFLNSLPVGGSFYIPFYTFSISLSLVVPFFSSVPKCYTSICIHRCNRWLICIASKQCAKLISWNSFQFAQCQKIPENAWTSDAAEAHDLFNHQIRRWLLATP